MAKVTEYVVEEHDTATGDRSVWFAPSVEDLRRSLADKTTVGEPRVVEKILKDLLADGEVEYDSDDVFDDPDAYGLTIDEVESSDLPQMRLHIFGRTIQVTAAEEVLRALHKINVHRARVGQPALDPVESNWSVDDVLREAKRLA